MDEMKEPSIYPRCQICGKTIKVDEGRFSCGDCRSVVCEECGKGLRWSKGTKTRERELRECPQDGSVGMDWIEGKARTKDSERL